LTRYAVNAPNVIHENIEGETMVLNLATGRYYGLTGVAADIFTLLTAGLPPEHVAAAVAARYEGSPDAIDEGVRAFVEALREESLVVEAPGGAATGDTSLAPLPERPAFVTPILTPYTDMEQLLLLDPIHEVSESGWPEKK